MNDSTNDSTNDATNPRAANRGDTRLRQALGDLLDTAPAAPESPRDLAVFAPVPARRYAPVLVGALAIAAVAAGGIVIASRGGDVSDTADGPAVAADVTVPPSTTPTGSTGAPSTMAPFPSLSAAWKQAVDAVIADQPGWGSLVTEVESAEAEPFMASVVALVGDTGRIVFDVHEFAPGEYSNVPRGKWVSPARTRRAFPPTRARCSRSTWPRAASVVPWS